MTPLRAVEAGQEHKDQRTGWPRAARAGLALAALLGAATLPVHGDTERELVEAVAPLPEVRLAGSTYELNNRSRPLVREYPHGDDSDDWTTGSRYFGSLSTEDDRTGAKEPLVYAVEGMSGGPIPQYCGNDGACGDVGIGVVAHTGRLHVVVDRPRHQWRQHQAALGMADWPAQDVEVSVTDSGSGLKVFREIEVLAPSGAPDCHGYPAMDPDRFTCLFLREELPAEPPTTTAALRAGLPDLVQPAENYELVFAEEFGGTTIDRTSGCENRMGNVDGDLWEYDRDPCNDTDPRGEPCFNVRNGRLSISIASGCSSKLETEGKFSYRYGYLEVRYTVTLRYPGFYSNFAAVQWAGGFRQSLRHQHDRYGVVVDSYESVSKNLGVELDLFEYVPKGSGSWDGTIAMHQYMNWDGGKPLVDHPAVRPQRTDKHYQLRCGFPQPCHGDRQMTLTSGFEWTPRGYRNFGKLRGSSGDFERIPQDRVLTRYKTRLGDTGFYSRWRHFSEDERRRLFEETEPGNPESMLEQVAIAHIPASLELVAWGYPQGTTSIRTRVEIDYVRVFQPVNRYTDMDPLYQ